MRTIRLGRLFDAVFIHDAIMYMTNEADLRQAIKTAYVHCQPDGVILIAPDFLLENFRSSTDHGGHDGTGRAMRYLAWTKDPKPGESTYVSDLVYIFEDEQGSVRIEHDRHTLGIFPRQTWLTLLTNCGFQAEVIPFDHSEIESLTYKVLLGRKIPG